MSYIQDRLDWYNKIILSGNFNLDKPIIEARRLRRCFYQETGFIPEEIKCQKLAKYSLTYQHIHRVAINKTLEDN